MRAVVLQRLEDRDVNTQPGCENVLQGLSTLAEEPRWPPLTRSVSLLQLNRASQNGCLSGQLNSTEAIRLSMMASAGWERGEGGLVSALRLGHEPTPASSSFFTSSAPEVRWPIASWETGAAKPGACAS